MDHAGFPNGLNTNEREVINKLKCDSDKAGYHLMIEYDHFPTGEMSYYDRKNHTAEIGIKICEKDYQNRGLGRIILSLLIKELFNNGYERIILDTNLKNTRAQHAYEKLGFRKIKVRMNSWVDQVGQLQSAVDYELNRCEFHDYSMSEGS